MMGIHREPPSVIFLHFTKFSEILTGGKCENSVNNDWILKNKQVETPYRANTTSLGMVWN